MPSTPTAVDLSTIKSMAIERLGWARGFLDNLLGSLDDDQLTARAGGRGNHALWIMGHLAHSEEQIVSAASGRPGVLPESYGELFGTGTEPTDNAADYPSRNELREQLQAVRRRTLDWAESLDEETAFAPMPEPLQPFAKDSITVPFGLAAHDMIHAGQVAAVRSSLGLSPVMM